MGAAARVLRALRVCGFAAMFGWIAVVTLRRAGALIAGAALDGVEERRWMAWSHRDPPLVGLLDRAQGELGQGEAVVLVCAPDSDPSFLLMMAEYALPGQAVVGAKIEGAPGRILPTRIQRTNAGVRVQRRSEAGPLDGRR